MNFSIIILISESLGEISTAHPLISLLVLYLPILFWQEVGRPPLGRLASFFGLPGQLAAALRGTTAPSPGP